MFALENGLRAFAAMRRRCPGGRVTVGIDFSASRRSENVGFREFWQEVGWCGNTRLLAALSLFVLPKKSLFSRGKCCAQ